MKILTKFLSFLFPPVVLFILAMGGINYHLSVKALNKLADTWLSGKLTEAMGVLTEQENNLRKYGLENILGSKIKAQIDAAALFKSMDMGDRGYLFAVNSTGTVKIHPDPDEVDSNIMEQEWFKAIVSGEKKTTFMSDGNTHLAISGYFRPWDWYVFAADPVEDYYGPANRIKPYLLTIGILGSISIAMIIILLVRRLMTPLHLLTQGANQLGKGDLHTRISIHSNDEFSILSNEFNEMAHNLQKLTVSRNELENEIEQKEEVEKEREKLINELKHALNKIKTLEGIIPICAKCKKIRDDKGYWNNLEAYIEEHSDAFFSHGMCPECLEDLYGDKMWFKKTPHAGKE
ncbi:MAG: HAMP domain-containing protein [Desulfobacteraceae bacterium]|nr:MAG: HAMP domain-containing protein [Desulfobacteraceae bacterium]